MNTDLELMHQALRFGVMLRLVEACQRRGMILVRWTVAGRQ